MTTLKEFIEYHQPNSKLIDELARTIIIDDSIDVLYELYVLAFEYLNAKKKFIKMLKNEGLDLIR